jgi:RNA-directed DNA polymerase
MEPRNRAIPGCRRAPHTRKATAGMAGQTWATYGEQLDTNLRDLADRPKRGAYQAPPVERVSIPKADGRQRPIGKPTLEDKIVQRATVEVLNAIYEEEFVGFSYGARPGRNPHHALDAVTVGGLQSAASTGYSMPTFVGFTRRSTTHG